MLSLLKKILIGILFAYIVSANFWFTTEGVLSEIRKVDAGTYHIYVEKVNVKPFKTTVDVKINYTDKLPQYRYCVDSNILFLYKVYLCE